MQPQLKSYFSLTNKMEIVPTSQGNVLKCMVKLIHLLFLKSSFLEHLSHLLLN